MTKGLGSGVKLVSNVFIFNCISNFYFKKERLFLLFFIINIIIQSIVSGNIVFLMQPIKKLK